MKIKQKRMKKRFRPIFKQILVVRMIAKRFAFPSSRSFAKGIAVKASMATIIANHEIYSGCPVNFTAFEMGVEKIQAKRTNIEEVHKTEIKVVV